MIKFIWWNTGFCPPIPPSKKTLGKRDLDSAMATILELIEIESPDFIGRCEINNHFMKELNCRLSALYGTRFCCVSSYDRVNADNDMRKYSIIDTGYIYNSTSISASGHKSHFALKGNKKDLFGTKIPVYLSGMNMVINLVHLPAKGRSKDSYVSHLLHKIKDDSYIDQEISPVIIMGDFNRDLFSNQVRETFEYADDRQFCSKKRALYNPFWRCLGEKYPDLASESFCGSFYFIPENQWNFPDFVLISSQFLEPTHQLVIDEDQTAVLGNLKTNPTLRFDHHPIRFSLKEVQ
jgi:hypothetical protein